MEPYKNLGHDSGIAAYEIGDDLIKVKFKQGGTYVYTYQSAGKNHIETMKKLAISGQGLNSYISRNVKHLFARKE